MSGRGPRFWDPRKRAAYLDRVVEKADAAQRRKDGEATAEALDRIWAGLAEPERAVIDALLACDRRSFVAPHDQPALRNLVAKGLLAYPRGQGGNWMRAAKTSYNVPPAVWNKLRNRHTESHGAAGQPSVRRNAEAFLKRMADGDRRQG